MGLVLVVGVINFFGPKHSGSVSLYLAIPAVLTVITIIGLSSGYLTPPTSSPRTKISGSRWTQFVGVILALSGVEAIANITGVMKLDPGSTAEHPKVTRTAAKAIIPVAIEVVVGTALARLGDAFVLPQTLRTASLTSALGETCFAFSASTTARVVVAPWFGSAFGLVVGVVFGLLLFSAVNTAVVALIGVIYMMAQDGEMPRQLARLNRHGVPRIPLFVAVGIPILVLAVTPKFEGTRRPLRDRRGRRDRGQSRFLHFQQAARSHLVPTPAHGRDLSHPRGRRTDHRARRNRTRSSSPSASSASVSRLRAYSHKLSGIKDRHHDQGSRRNGRAQSPRDDAAAA